MQQFQTFSARCTTALRLAHARGTGRIEKVHVKTEVGRSIPDSLAKISTGFAHAATEQIAPGNNLEPEIAREWDDTLEALRSANADVERPVHIEQPFLGGAGEGRRRAEFIRGLSGACIRVRVDVNQG